MLRRRTFLALLPMLLLVPAQTAAESKSPVVLVVVHEDVQVEQLSEAELAMIFTTRRREWPNGDRIIPLNLAARDPLRVAFDEAVLHMSPEEVARYWIDRRVRGGNRPPKQVPSEKLMAKVVSKLSATIGYVSADARLSGVRVVAKVVDGEVVAP